MKEFNPDLVPENAKILIIKLRSIGDVIYNTSVYGPLKKRWPKAHLAVAVEPPSDEIVRNHPDVDETLCFRKDSWFNQLFFYLRLFVRRYDIAIDMHEGPRGAVMCFITAARWRIGNQFAKRSFLYNTPLDFSDLKPKYPVDFQVALIRKMGVGFDADTAPAIHLSASGREKALRLLADNKIDGPFCILHPGARIYDQWQPEKFAGVAEQCHSQFGLKVVLTTGPGQENQLKDVERQMKTPFVSIQAGLEEMAAIAEQARFVVCHNGGFMHLSAAVGTPTISLFGLSNPNIWKPQGERHAVVSKPIDCWPCNRTTIKTVCLEGAPECKQLIMVEDVVREIENILAENPSNK